jgi:small nuclear ribonucleoprotein (snRNP)-like protein
MAVTIRAVDQMEGNIVIIELSDGRTVQVTLEQILRLNPKVQAENETDSN